MDTNPLDIKRSSRGDVLAVATPVAPTPSGEYHDYATYEGQVEALRICGGQTFTLHEPVYGEIPCVFAAGISGAGDDSMMRFTGRVAVSGRATYNRTGHPTLLTVETVLTLRDAPNLPQIRDIPALDLTGGMDSTAYIQGLRVGD